MNTLAGCRIRWRCWSSPDGAPHLGQRSLAFSPSLGFCARRRAAVSASSSRRRALQPDTCIHEVYYGNVSLSNYQTPHVQLTEGLTQILRGPIVATVDTSGRIRL